jgi:hypothetical protein
MCFAQKVAIEIKTDLKSQEHKIEYRKSAQ